MTTAIRRSRPNSREAADRREKQLLKERARRQEMIDRLLDNEPWATHAEQRDGLDLIISTIALRLFLKLYVEIGTTAPIKDGMSPLEQVEVATRYQLFTSTERSQRDAAISDGIARAMTLLEEVGEIVETAA